MFLLLLSLGIVTVAWSQKASGSTGLFTSEQDLVIYSASVDDSRVNPSQDVTFTGTMYYEATTTPPKAGASALSFDGIDDYVEVPNDASLNPTVAMTLEAWIKITGDDDKTIVSKRIPGEFGYTLAYAGGYELGVNFEPTGWLLDDVPLPLNKFVYVAATYDGAYVRLYVNGDNTKSKPATEEMVQGNIPLSIGHRDTGFSHQGVIDEVHIYNRALSAKEISEHYQGIYENETGLVLYLPFDGDAQDKSGQGNHATVYGAMWTDGWTDVSAKVELDGVLKKTVRLVNSTTGTFTIPNITAPSTVGSYAYTIYATTPAGNTVQNQTITVIVDRLKIIIKEATDTRVNVGSSTYVYFNVTREYDNTIFNEMKGSVYINGFLATWDATNKYWKLNISDASVGAWDLRAHINDTEFGISMLNDLVGAKQVIWDRIKIIEGGVTQSSTYLGETETVWFKAVYEFDNVKFDAARGTLYLNGSAMEWSTSNDRWEYNYTMDTAGPKTFKVTGVLDTQYGLTTVNDVVGPQIITSKSKPFIETPKLFIETPIGIVTLGSIIATVAILVLLFARKRKKGKAPRAQDLTKTLPFESEGEVANASVNRKVRDKAFVVLALGVFIRLLLMLYTSHVAYWPRVMGLDNLFIGGLNPLAHQVAHGISFWIFYSPSYMSYLILNSLGIYHTFLIDFLMKVPSLAADIVIFYSLYNLGFLVTGSEKRGLLVSSLYFLNPYTIWMSGVIGPGDQLMSAFLLLALLFLFKGNMSRSAVCLSVTTFFRYFSVLFLPVFLFQIWRKRDSPSLFSFLKAFLVMSLVLSIPYFLVIVPVYLASPQGLQSYMNFFLSPTATGVAEYARLMRGTPSPTDFSYNFTGFLATIGIWPILQSFFNFRNFLLVYLFVTVAILFLNKTSSSPIQSLNRHIIAVFCLFMLLTPLVQHHYLLWIFPFLLLASHVFFEIPKYYPLVIWVANVMIDPVILGAFITYFDDTFPGVLDQLVGPWLVYNLELMLSISVLSGLFFILVFTRCVMPLANQTKDAQTQTSAVPTLGLKDWFFVALTLSYGVLEILRIAYEFPDQSYYLLTPFGALIVLYLLFKFRQRTNSRGKVTFNLKSLFPTNLSRMAALLYLSTILASLVVIPILTLDLPIFLLIQVVFFGCFWFLNGSLEASLYLQRVFFVFTPVYMSLLLLITKSPIQGFILLLYVASWLFLQIRNVPVVKISLKGVSQSETRTIAKELGRLSGRKTKLRIKVHSSFLRLFGNRRILCLTLSVVLILAYVPLMKAVADGSIPNSRSYFLLTPTFIADYETSSGHVDLVNQSVLVGNLSREESSWAEWESSLWSIPLMGPRLKEVTEAYLVVVGDYPLTSTQPYIQSEKVGWDDDAFGEGWVDAQGGDNATVDEGIVEVGREFRAGTRSSYILRKDLPAINSSEYPFVMVRWRSTDHVARFCVFDSEGDEYKVIVETEAGVIQYPAIDYGGGYSSSWTTTIYELPPNKTITLIDLGVDSGAWGITALGGEHPISGEQHAYFDYVMFAQGQIEGSHVTVKLNNNTIFDEKLMASKDELLTVHPDVFASTIVKGVYVGEDMGIQVNATLLRTENRINVTVGGHSIWKVSTMLIVIGINVDEMDSPIWRSFVPHMLLALAFSVTVVLWAFRNFYRKMFLKTP